MTERMDPHAPEFDPITELLQARKENRSTRDIVQRFQPNEIPHHTVLEPHLKLNLLHIVASAGDLDTIRELRHRGADPAAKTAGGFTAVHLAACRGHTDAVRELIGWPGLDVGGTVSDESFTPLHLAAYGGHAGTVQQLLLPHSNGGGTVDVNTKDGVLGRTALHFAAQGGHEEVVRLLMSSAAIEVQSKDRVRHLTPFLLAAMKPPKHGFSLRVVEILLNVNVGQIHDTVGTLRDQTAEVLRKFSEEPWRELRPIEVIDGRLAGVDDGPEDWVDDGAEEKKDGRQNEKDLRRRLVEGHTALHLAATENNAELIKYLVARQDPNEGDTEFGMTPLHCAVKMGATEAFNALMAVDGIDVNARSGKQQQLPRPRYLPGNFPKQGKYARESEQFDTPLHLAVRACRGNVLWEMVIQFVNHPKFDGVIHNNLGECALELAWSRLRLCPRPPLIFQVLRRLSKDPSTDEKFVDDERMYLNKAICVLERHPSNAPIINNLAETRKAAQDSVNAFLVTAALLGNLTFNAYLKPPFGTELTEVGEYKITPVKLFWVFNSLSFYFAMYTIIRSLVYIIRSDGDWGHSFTRSEFLALIRIHTAVPLIQSVVFGIAAFAAAGFGNLPSGRDFMKLMWVCTAGGIFLIGFELLRILVSILFLLYVRPLGYPLAYVFRHFFGKGSTPHPFSGYGWEFRFNFLFLGIQIFLAIAVVIFLVLVL